MSFVDKWIDHMQRTSYQWDHTCLNDPFEQTEKKLFDATQELKKLIESSKDFFATTEEFEQSITEILENSVWDDFVMDPALPPFKQCIYKAAKRVSEHKDDLEFMVDPKLSSEEITRKCFMRLKDISLTLDDMNSCNLSKKIFYLEQKIKVLEGSTRQTRSLFRTFHLNFNTFWGSLVDDVQGLRLGINTTFRHMRGFSRTHFDGTYAPLKQEHDSLLQSNK